MTVTECPGLGFTFDALNSRDGLIRLDKQFLESLAGLDPARHQRLLATRT